MVDYYNERQILEYRIGRKLSDDDILSLGGKRYRADHLRQLTESKLLYVFCDICGKPFCVNNHQFKFGDMKPRTPKYKDFIVCGECDPRHAEDRYMKTGYRILFKDRLRIIQMAQVCRALRDRPCRNHPGENIVDKCPECVAGKLFPPF